MAEQKRPHVVILGGGFGGLYAARELADAPVDVTVIDRRNHHLFQPLLYQVATAALSPSEIAVPIRNVVRTDNARVLMGEVVAIDVDARTLDLRDGERLAYDFLVVATGVTHSYFGNDQWAAHAPGLKSIEDALEIRSRVLMAFEHAEREKDPERRRALTTFIIIGAGPTGVELAGALAEVSRHALKRDFKNIDPSKSRIVLIEGLPKVLPSYPDDLATTALESLRKKGVEVLTSTRVTAIDDDGVEIGDRRINAETVLWAAGVAASPLARFLRAPMDRAGRVKVTERLTVPGHDEIFVVGDLASFEQDGAPIPGVAPAAMQGGKHAGKNILRALRGEPGLPFSYWDRGTFSVIGRGSAVGIAFRRWHFKGLLAWLGWLFIHIFFLIGFRNRIAVLVNWGYSFFTFGRSARLITYGPRSDPDPKARPFVPTGQALKPPQDAVPLDAPSSAKASNESSSIVSSVTR